jgi:calcineurin-like phosphoesterase family protein
MERSKARVTLDKKLNTMKHNFNLSESDWITLNTTITTSIINRESPAVIFIATENEQALNFFFKDMILLHQKLLKRIKNLDEIYIDLGDQFVNNNDTMLLDNKLNKLFNSGYKMAILGNIEKLTAPVMALFYSYGDGFGSAKYEDVIIFMSHNNKERINDKKELEQYLKDSFINRFNGTVHEDQLFPLFTRILINIINLC